MERRGHWMQTFGGRRYYVEDPRAEEVHIEDIAHALSRVCRFGGMTREHYSVAQHSVLVSLTVASLGGTPEEIRYGLLHDASEAYIGDVIWPLKQAPAMSGYRIIEKLNEDAIAERFGLSPTMPAVVKHADLVALATEKRDVMRESVDVGRQLASLEANAARDALGAWHCDVVEPLPGKLIPMEAMAAKALFLARWHELGGDL